MGDSDDLSGEIHLNRLALGGVEEGAEEEGPRGRGDVVGEGRDWRKGGRERDRSGLEYLKDKDGELWG